MFHNYILNDIKIWKPCFIWFRWLVFATWICCLVSNWPYPAAKICPCSSPSTGNNFSSWLLSHHSPCLATIHTSHNLFYACHQYSLINSTPGAHFYYTVKLYYVFSLLFSRLFYCPCLLISYFLFIFLLFLVFFLSWIILSQLQDF